ncbi:hypothetical protein ES703_07012 [subsurface metagenome]
MSKTNLMLTTLLLSIICYSILVVPTLKDNHVPTRWGSAIDYGREHIVRTGRVFDPSIERCQTWQSNLKDYGAQEILPKILFASTNIICGITSFPEDVDFFSFIPFAGLLLTPFSIIAIYISGAKRFNIFDSLLIFLVSIFPLSSAVTPGSTNGTPMARGLFLVLLLLLLSSCNVTEKNTKPYKIALFMFFLFPFYSYYHTWSYYFMLVMGVILFLSLITRKKQLALLAFFPLLAYAIAALYYNYHQLFYIPLSILTNILTNIGRHDQIGIEFHAYQSLSNVYSYIQAINVALVLSVILFFSIGYLVRQVLKKSVSQAETIVFFLICGLPVVGLSLFLAGGIGMFFSRFLEFGVNVFLICAAFIISQQKKKKRFEYIMTRIILLIIIVLCVFSFFNKPAQLKTNLSHEEFVGIDFIGVKSNHDAPFFSDFRIGTSLIYYDKTSIYTIDSPKQSNAGIFEDLMRIYYNTTLPHDVLDKIVGTTHYFVLTSHRQSEVALSDRSSHLKPANKSFQTNFMSDDNFDRIYNSYFFNVFYRT